jgi:hypothetical protein
MKYIKIFESFIEDILQGDRGPNPKSRKGASMVSGAILDIAENLDRGNKKSKQIASICSEFSRLMNHDIVSLSDIIGDLEKLKPEMSNMVLPENHENIPGIDPTGFAKLVTLMDAFLDKPKETGEVLGLTTSTVYTFGFVLFCIYAFSVAGDLNKISDIFGV